MEKKDSLDSMIIKSVIKKISVGNQMYFASQTITIVNNELDRRNI